MFVKHYWEESGRDGEEKRDGEGTERLFAKTLKHQFPSPFPSLPLPHPFCLLYINSVKKQARAILAS
jgi:hypothetical protein